MTCRLVNLEANGPINSPLQIAFREASQISSKTTDLRHKTPQRKPKGRLLSLRR